MEDYKEKKMRRRGRRRRGEREERGRELESTENTADWVGHMLEPTLYS